MKFILNYWKLSASDESDEQFALSCQFFVTYFKPMLLFTLWWKHAHHLLGNTDRIQNNSFTSSNCKFFYDFRGGQSLAWASAQLHCQCHVSESKVNLPTERKTEDNDMMHGTGYTSFVPSRGESTIR